MDASSTQLREELSTLRIPRDQRPRESARGRSGSGFGKALLTLAVIAGLASGGYVAWQKRDSLPLPGSARESPQNDVRLLKVAAKPASDPISVLTATGKIVSDHRVAVVTKVSGQIVELNFEQGDTVNKGQMLARIEDVNYRARRDQALANLEKARANLAFQRFNWSRIERMYEDKVATDVEYADAKRWLDDADAQVDADKAALEFAAKALADCEVVAPIAGVVLERNVEVGDFVAAEGGRGANANAQFALIADMTKLRVEVDISELDIARVRDGLPCAIAPDAYKDRHYSGHVMWIDPGANYAKATVQVKVRIDLPDDYLRVEGSAQVTFRAQDSAGASSQPGNGATTIWIPSSACVADSTGKSARVLAVVNGRLAERQVRLGRKNGAQIEVVDGLSDGESIAAADLDKLKPGQRVKP